MNDERRQDIITSDGMLIERHLRSLARDGEGVPALHRITEAQCG